MPAKESEIAAFLERKFVQGFLQRLKRYEKAVNQYKYPDLRDDDGDRKLVQCANCLKKRPLIGGMDPARLSTPFVCWMNFDECNASCSAPQGAILPRSTNDDDKKKSGNSSNKGVAASKTKRKSTSSASSSSKRVKKR